MKELFLDANAHISMPQEVLDYYCKLNSSISGHGHPNSLTKPGRRAANLIEESRVKIAELIGAKSSNQIFFTYGCTHGCEWAIDIFFKQAIKNKSNVKISSYEHPAMRDAFLKAYKNYYPDNFSNYIFSFNDDNSDYYCSIMHMQNEFGTIFDLKNIKRKFLLSDLSQSLGKIPVNVSELDIDIGVFACHKFGGFNGTGFIYLKNSDWWVPFGTGSRYFTDRTGTPDANMVATSAFALEFALKSLSERFQRSFEFQKHIESSIENDQFEIVEKSSIRSPNTTFVHKKNCINEILNLNSKNIYCGLGSACGSHATGISTSLQSFEKYKKCSPHDFMRISQWGEYGIKEAKYFLEQLRLQ